jgi:hypothetical protein
LGKLKEQTTLIKKNVFDLTVYTGGAINLMESWELTSEDREIIIDSFAELNAARSGKKKNEIRQEQL